MPRIVDRLAVALTERDRRMVTAPIALDPQTASIAVRLRLPTAAAKLAWRDTGVVQVTIVITADGKELRYRGGEFKGGTYLHYRTKEEIPEYTFRATPTFGYWNAREGYPKRLGETCKTAYTAHVELECLAGSVQTELSVDTVIAEAPRQLFHSSISIDAKSSAEEVPASGTTLSLSHTSSGTNRAAWVCSHGSNDPRPSASSMTYDGVAMTEQGDLATGGSFARLGAYSIAGQGTGALTVENTMTGVVGGEQTLIVVSLNGVDQSTPTGTAVTGSGTTTPATVTVGSVGSTDLVMDAVIQDFTTLTVGADQTEEQRESIGLFAIGLAVSSQPGTAGGVMSWTLGGASANTFGWAQVAVAFKAATSGQTIAVPVRAHTYTAQAPKVNAQVRPAQVAHSYTAQVPQVRTRVQPAVMTHTYTGRAPQVRMRVQPAAAAHAYTLPAPTFGGAVKPAQAAHSYTAQAPQARARVQSGAATHVYSGGVPDVVAGAAVAPPAAAHSYTGSVPQVRARVQPGVATHVYTGQVPVATAGAIVSPAQVAHSYAPMTPQVKASVEPAQVTHSYTPVAPGLVRSIRPLAVTHTYTAIAPQAQARVQSPVVMHVYTATAPTIAEGELAIFGWGARNRIGGARGSDRWQRIGSATATDSHERIGSEVAAGQTGKIGSDQA